MEWWRTTTIKNQPLSHRWVCHCSDNTCKINLIGSSCRTKATIRLAKLFATAAIAEQHFSKLFSHTSMLTTLANSPVCTVALSTPVTEPSVTAASVISSTDKLTTNSCIVTINPAVTSRCMCWDQYSTICISIATIQHYWVGSSSLWKCIGQLKIGQAVQSLD